MLKEGEDPIHLNTELLEFDDRKVNLFQTSLPNINI